ncbi:bifunctional pyr operon transcriptional regulator/uracil phosphoribosyltransferase PyrR [Marinobacter lutaoensis]|jgi:pyrimidine operon attenuation protein/uracil phosphoribosyltransferase|uniref:Bifunctional pyr operon transcriptional regulator/uracil phosphoribosyltransferase n=1 Tax=Marinobacter lutaoensis TaxID=135739 RepID=A0A1V2DNQ7_9GAMM|nr:bifunctional pyr operon transcriptional regulator/uracil phosphoribosyltransferase PyrR [Marinobacter lutaoensis]MBE02289.1 bifunctional pyr operon transcriptional regulator/uracil phosphoribosyltransferase [Marinobacter sp.]MBI43231.1 bifunctional pyr operon transcriptional regulator/uracil phosphoribosyltransferase [Oceanospirillales bacterium]MBI43797.1 bifunctional pyr operon transcriptional regulator/uracil phosphoribosyltransferase [Oceanospirillales bacterium]NVD35681.1 bifunctional p|tara:strand:+ start:383 stop:892 length:510 start_codon:yes stop_codon:yes gene_type:complete
MTAQLDIDRLLDEMEAGVRRILSERQVHSPVVIGIRTGGVWLADVLSKRLDIREPFGELDISFYRDDFSRIGLNPRVKPSSLPFDTEGRDILLIDDVIMSGRTIRAAMNEIFDYGRPASIILATLIDLGARELPIQPDVTGKVLALDAHQRIKLRGPDPLRIELQETTS